MMTEEEAVIRLEEEIPGVVIAARARYQNLYLFRIVMPDPLEADYDPFFSVDVETGEVRDFSVLTDGDMTEIAAAFGVPTTVEEVNHGS